MLKGNNYVKVLKCMDAIGTKPNLPSSYVNC